MKFKKLYVSVKFSNSTRTKRAQEHAEDTMRIKTHKLTTGHKDPEGEQRYSSTLSLTSAADAGGWLTPRPGHFTPGTDRTEGWVGPRAGLAGCGKSRPHRDSIPDRPARSELNTKSSSKSPHHKYTHTVSLTITLPLFSSFKHYTLFFTPFLYSTYCFTRFKTQYKYIFYVYYMTLYCKVRDLKPMQL